MVAVYSLGVYVGYQSAEQKKAFVSNIAEIILAQAESTIGDALKAAKELDSKHISSCSPDNLRDFRALSFKYPAIYEIGLFNEKGQVLCSNLGHMEQSIAGMGILDHDNKQMLHLMALDRLSGEKVLMLNFRRGEGTAIRVAISPKALFNGFLQKDLYKFGYASIKMNDGMMVNETGDLRRNQHQDSAGDIVSVIHKSLNYPITVTVEIQASVLPGIPFALYLFVYLGGAIFTVLIGMMISNLSKRDTNLRSEINPAMKRGELIPYYQPGINSGTGAIAGCEVLLRWKKSDGQLISPKLFIPYAEMNGQIIEITRNLMVCVRDEMAEFHKDNAGFFYSINLTAAHFDNKEILDDVQNIFCESVISTLDLIFEITERHPLHDIDTASLIIDGLQSLGSKVAIDDAGTGHGGLAYIQHLGVDKIKIDKMFVEAIDNNSPGAPIVDALINMSRELNISVIAEGVETESQLDYLCRHGAEYLQGYIFAKPMSKDSFIQFYNAYHREIVNITPRPVKKASPALMQTIAAAVA